MYDECFLFAPVKIERGRKFRGFAYLLDTTWTRIAYGVDYKCAKLWDPATKRIVFANAEFCKSVQEDEATTEAAKRIYIDATIASTIAWCRSTKPGMSEAEVKSFARNVLRKQHPEMMEQVNAALPDARDVVKLVENTLKWALSLRTRPMVLYGKRCPGGKAYPAEKVVQIALRALEKKGATKLDGFDAALEMNLTLMALPKPTKATKEETANV